MELWRTRNCRRRMRAPGTHEQGKYGESDRKHSNGDKLACTYKRPEAKRGYMSVGPNVGTKTKAEAIDHILRTQPTEFLR